MENVSLVRLSEEELRSETMVSLALHLDAFWMFGGHDFGHDALVQAYLSSWGNSGYFCVNEYGEPF